MKENSGMTDEKQSILNSFIDSINWSLPLENLKQDIIAHIQENCNNAYSKRKMALEIHRIEDLSNLQRYTFNALLKFEGQGVIEMIPR